MKSVLGNATKSKFSYAVDKQCLLKSDIEKSLLLDLCGILK